MQSQIHSWSPEGILVFTKGFYSDRTSYLLTNFFKDFEPMAKVVLRGLLKEFSQTWNTGIQVYLMYWWTIWFQPRIIHMCIKYFLPCHTIPCNLFSEEKKKHIHTFALFQKWKTSSSWHLKLRSPPKKNFGTASACIVRSGAWNVFQLLYHIY